MKARAKADLALVKVLSKLNLLDSGFSAKDFRSGEFCPIYFFALKGAFEESDACQIVADHLRLPLVRIDRARQEEISRLLENPIIKSIGPERWKSLRALPYKLEGPALSVVFANPLDREEISALEFELSLRVQVAIGLEREILDYLLQRTNADSMADLQSIVEQNEQQNPAGAANEEAPLESTVMPGEVGSAPIVRLVNKIFSDSVEAGASDIHISPEKEILKVRIRVDGIMQPLLEVPAMMRGPVTSRIKLLAGMDISEKRKPQDGRLRIKSVRGLRDLRISTVPAVHGENVVVRILSAELSRVSFDSLGMSEELQARMRDALSGSSKVVLISGPTGSGKSSTLYAALLALRDGTHNIITVEDPIEYRLEGITQIQVNTKIGVSFAEGLRSILRQDPDVIMVGEIRDRETASIAMQTAQTGHLVFSTIHTNNAPATITRLQDLGVPPFLISSSLSAVISQRLVRRLCPDCAKPWGSEIGDAYAGSGLIAAGMREPVGCPECRSTGYRGRVGVFSFLEISEPLREAIRGELGEGTLETLARANGYKSLEEAGIDLVNSGATSLSELERVLGSLKGLRISRPSTAAAAANAVQAAPQLNGGLARQKVLLVEDDENTRAVLSLLLRGEMFEVEEAANGVEALEKIYQQVPQVIILDLMMPKMNGSEVVQRLRRDPRTRAIPILMLTAADSDENELQAISAGADDFVSKTTDAKVMLARVYRLLDRAGAA
ncbi:MAG: Flp pilus assembly complex ATPase component TadA [Oligoflexia bacterium]|nr:Flp pilus assembly complex ATPase component TadA [Oligoflexia bacterium]